MTQTLNPNINDLLHVPRSAAAHIGNLLYLLYNKWSIPSL